MSINGIPSEVLRNDSFIKDQQQADGFSGGDAVRTTKQRPGYSSSYQETLLMIYRHV